MYRAIDGSWIDEWTGDEPNFYDAAVRSFRQHAGSNHLICERVASNRAGDLKLSLTDGYSLEVFVPGAVHREYWRFFRMVGDSEHLVILSAPDRSQVGQS